MNSITHSYTAVYFSPVGTLGIQFQKQKFSHIDWLARNLDYSISETDNTSFIIQTLDSYFQHGEWEATIPIEWQGTGFQQRVWKSLLAIPYGQTKTYGEVAKELNTSSRAVGQACKRNRIPILIPCHRVVARDHIGGFFGKAEHSHIKEWLLNHEARH